MHLDVVTNSVKIISHRERSYDDYSPKWSPDGKILAFMSNRSHQDSTEVHFINANTNEEPVKATHVDGNIEFFHWSHSGHQVLLGVHQKPNQSGNSTNVSDKVVLKLPLKMLPGVFFWSTQWRIQPPGLLQRQG